MDEQAKRIALVRLTVIFMRRTPAEVMAAAEKMIAEALATPFVTWRQNVAEAATHKFFDAEACATTAASVYLSNTCG